MLSLDQPLVAATWEDRHVTVPQPCTVEPQLSEPLGTRDGP